MGFIIRTNEVKTNKIGVASIKKMREIRPPDSWYTKGGLHIKMSTKHTAKGEIINVLEDKRLSGRPQKS